MSIRSLAYAPLADVFTLRRRRTANVVKGLRRVAVLTHHKCASTFVSFYLKRFGEQNRLRTFQTHRGDAVAAREFHVSILTNAVYDVVRDHIECPAIHIIRNPLDIVVSAYYSHFSTHDVEGWPALGDQRRVLAGCSREQGFFLTLAFLERADFYTGTPGPLHALRCWNFDDERIRTVRMEDIVKDVNYQLGGFLIENLAGPIELPSPGDFTFERITGGRHAGEIDDRSHYRSGRPGEWRRDLPEPVINYIRTHFRPLLERYYRDSLV